MNAQRPDRHPQAVGGHGRWPLCLLDAVEVALVVRVPGPAVSAAVAADGGRKRPFSVEVASQRQAGLAQAGAGAGVWPICALGLRGGVERARTDAAFRSVANQFQ